MASKTTTTEILILILSLAAFFSPTIGVDPVELAEEDLEEVPGDALDEIVDKEAEEHQMAFAIAPLTRGDVVEECEGKLELVLTQKKSLSLGKESYPNLKRR